MLLGLYLAAIAYARSAAEWNTRTVYQLLTDRFGGTTQNCQNLGNYCGGTFKGIVNHLDYITGMGFDAIWISPVVDNTPGGYHGYWARNFFEINSHFGSKQDLIDLVKAAHAKNVWVMVDIVANHAAPVGSDFSQIYPFNSSADYHKTCQVSHYSCFTDEILNCRLADLPDLNQDVPFVANELLRWIKWLMSTFNFDGIRADTVMYIKPAFWKNFSMAANSYIVGEVLTDLNCNVAYMKDKAVDGTLSYPMYYTLLDVFRNGKSMNLIEGQWKNYQAIPNLNAMGNFIDNHDQARFLNGHQDKVNQYKAAMAYVLLSAGVPMIYYGSEHLFSGGNDPACRETLWPTGYSKPATYTWLAKVIGVRKARAVWKYPQVQRYSTDNFYAFTRGDTLVALTNSNNQVRIEITYHPYTNGTTICNALGSSSTSDCLTVQGGKFTVTLQNGEVKIYSPK